MAADLIVTLDTASNLCVSMDGNNDIHLDPSPYGSVTEEAIIDALGYTPADADDVSSITDDVTELSGDVSELKSDLHLGDYGKFLTTASSNGWHLIDFSVKANKKYKFTNVGSVVITPNIYGATGTTYTPLYTGTGTSNIAVGGSVEFVAAQDDEKIRIYYTTGNNGFEISEISGVLKDIDDLQTEQVNQQNEIEALNKNQVQIIYNSDTTTLSDGRIKAFTGEVAGTGQNAYSYIEVPVTQGDIIKFTPNTSGTGSSYGYALYDSSKTYVTGAAPTADELCTITIPSGVAYFRYGQVNTAWSNDTYKNIYLTKLRMQQALVDLVRYDVAYKSLNGKTWNAVGDSITYQERYLSRVANITGVTAVNCGVGGSTIAINNTYMENQSIVERVLGLNGNTAYSDADVWTVMGGLNDCLYSSPIGSLESVGATFDNSTIYGALQSICEYILNLRSHPRLILMTPTQSLRDTWDTTTYPTTIALIRQAIIEVGKVYSIPVLDVWAEGGISLYNIQKETNPTTSDGVHINNLGADIISPYIAHGIKNVFYGV